MLLSMLSLHHKVLAKHKRMNTSLCINIRLWPLAGACLDKWLTLYEMA